MKKGKSMKIISPRKETCKQNN